jgi:glutamate-5-semialdehyde dehydrogenase
MTIKNKIENISVKAKEASLKLLGVSESTKNEALLAMAKALRKNKASILGSNKRDVYCAIKRGFDRAFIDRLSLNEKRIEQMAVSLEEIARLKSCVGEQISLNKRPNGLLIKKVRVPIGLICIIYESRPDVTSDCIGLCLKSSNALILRGGTEALNSNLAIFKILNKAMLEKGIPQDAYNVIDVIDRNAVKLLLNQTGVIDLAMPRGGESLIKEVVKFARIPVIKHYKGICHVYVDDDADLNMAENICFNAKCQRPGVCNAMETLLVHEGVAARFLPGMAKRFIDAGVEIRTCERSFRILKKFKGIKKATQKDWTSEYLDLIISIKVVNDLFSAIEHINNFGSHHSDSIITDDKQRQEEFFKMVDSACLYANASTRFTDGYQFGMGAEIGISTDKLHARGPMGIEELTTYKYTVYGNGQVRT